MALARYIDRARQAGAPAWTLQPMLEFLRRQGEALLRLQNDDLDHGAGYGGIRLGPKATDPAYDMMITENNLSAYAALRAITRVNGDGRFAAATARIEEWLRKAPVFNTLTGRMQEGLRDPATGLFFTGMTFSSARNRWEIIPTHPSDAVTWAISALGPAKIDALWGERSAYEMWAAVRRRMGRTVESTSAGQYLTRASGPDGRLDGIDFTDQYPDTESLISPEWTAGALFAMRQLLRHYGTGRRARLSAEETARLSADIGSVGAFLANVPDTFAIGPGHGGGRQGQSGFNFRVAPPEVTSMAAVYTVLGQDPLAWWRGEPAVPRGGDGRIPRPPPPGRPR